MVTNGAGGAGNRAGNVGVSRRTDEHQVANPHTAAEEQNSTMLLCLGGVREYVDRVVLRMTSIDALGNVDGPRKRKRRPGLCQAILSGGGMTFCILIRLLGSATADSTPYFTF